jgi:Do/DeqQ family serine protease
MSKRSYFFSMLLASTIGGVAAITGYKMVFPDKIYTSYSTGSPVRLSSYDYDTTKVTVPAGLNFIHAADLVTPAVVHIRTYYETQAQAQGKGNDRQMDPFREFFGDQFQVPQGPKEASGSGVILSEDGYIVTNNHVIDKADRVEVVLDDKRKFTANVLGTDPTTDLALLKVEEHGLPFVSFGLSDNLRVGEWVLAVGNPFNLNSTVTAGIVSAKARNINILSRADNRYAIESFIQTDAAVNPGNSGGALVNLKGELIGINTAIASNTGSYTGYSFAVPSALVKKIVDDLTKYGEVQRGLLGISIQDLTAEFVEQKGIKHMKGVYVAGVNENSGAKEAGLKEGDVVTKINEAPVATSSELQEQVARYRPGDKLKVTYVRDGKEETTTAILKNKLGNTEIVKVTDHEVIQSLGATFEEATKEEKTKLKISSGVKVSKLAKGKLQNAGMKEGFIVTHVDKNPVGKPEQVAEILQSKKGGVLIEGFYPNGEKGYYGIGL